MLESLDNIFAVIVLYKVQLHESKTFLSLQTAIKNQTGCLDVLLYNNSPEINIQTTAVVASNMSLRVINDNENSGVSRAYNMAYQFAEKASKNWLLLLDQDCELAINLFTAFFSERKIDDRDTKLYFPVIKTGQYVLSPGRYIPYRSFIHKSVVNGYVDFKKLAVINCGSFIALPVFKLAGGFNEQVALDFSDVSFFRRVKKICTNAFVLNAICNHDFSGSDFSNIESTKNRFKIFLKNARAFGNEEGVSKLLLLVTVFVRTINLTKRFRTLYFLNLLFFK